MLPTCHYYSLVDVCSYQTIARSWESSRIDPLGRVLHQQLRGGEVVPIIIVIGAAGDEECLKDDEATRITINIYLGPLLILKVAAPMSLSALL